MKKLSFINKVMFLINNVFALLLVLTFALPYIKPSSIATAPVVGLMTPILILVNILFVVYWIIIGFKRPFILSALVLIIGYFFSPTIYKFSFNKEIHNQNTLSILSYNIRKFNKLHWIEDDSIPQKITKLITTENPDIVALQEYKNVNEFSIDYPYHYNPNINKQIKSGLALFSKFPIINSGKIDSKKHNDRIIFIDILKNNDTIRIYNIHLQSLGLVPDKEYMGYKDSDKLVKRLRYSFKLQEQQINTLNTKLKQHKNTTIIAGDMNNTAYSWAYKNLKGDLKDTFLKAGKGFGKTYNFKGFPLRIDYIFVDEKFKVLQHKNYDVKYSDHYPIMATIAIK